LERIDTTGAVGLGLFTAVPVSIRLSAGAMVVHREPAPVKMAHGRLLPAPHPRLRECEPGRNLATRLQLLQLAIAEMAAVE